MIRPTGFNVLPPVIKNLLIINGLFFLATIIFQSRLHIDLIDIFGLKIPLAPDFEPYQIITYMFMHGGFGHLFFNMFALWMFGNVLENHWGPKRFIIYYLVTGIGAAATHYLVLYYVELAPTINAVNAFLDSPSNEAFLQFVNSEHFKITSTEIMNNFNEFRPKYNSLLQQGETYDALNKAVRFAAEYKMNFYNAPNVVGASGSVFGLLLAFGMLFPNQVIYLYFAIPIKAKYFVILYGGISLYAGFADKATNVAHFAHLGGMIFGFILIMLWKKRQNYFD
ncbi:MAG: rhomboid family intramembrane serine protease [Bacteroidetes bacterium]|nr:rhomboid family intramembrane serine protease [Bacteroidota bacterium]